MKNLILLTIPFIVSASVNTLSPKDHMSIHITNHSSSQKLMKKRKLHSFHKITDEQVESIVKKVTGESSTFIRLTHRSNYLIYKVTTENYRLDVNALDGTLIKQELKKEM